MDCRRVSRYPLRHFVSFLTTSTLLKIDPAHSRKAASLYSDKAIPHLE